MRFQFKIYSKIWSLIFKLWKEINLYLRKKDNKLECPLVKFFLNLKTSNLVSSRILAKYTGATLAGWLPRQSPIQALTTLSSYEECLVVDVTPRLQTLSYKRCLHLGLRLIVC